MCGKPNCFQQKKAEQSWDEILTRGLSILDNISTIKWWPTCGVGITHTTGHAAVHKRTLCRAFCSALFSSAYYPECIFDAWIHESVNDEWCDGNMLPIIRYHIHRGPVDPPVWLLVLVLGRSRCALPVKIQTHIVSTRSLGCCSGHSPIITASWPTVDYRATTNIKIESKGLAFNASGCPRSWPCPA